jgi:hypothetical protein
MAARRITSRLNLFDPGNLDQPDCFLFSR